MEYNNMLVSLITMHEDVPRTALGALEKERRENELPLFVSSLNDEIRQVYWSEKVPSSESKAGYTGPFTERCISGLDKEYTEKHRSVAQFCNCLLVYN